MPSVQFAILFFWRIWLCQIFSGVHIITGDESVRSRNENRFLESIKIDHNFHFGKFCTSTLYLGHSNITSHVCVFRVPCLSQLPRRWRPEKAQRNSRWFLQSLLKDLNTRKYPRHPTLRSSYVQLLLMRTHQSMTSPCSTFEPARRKNCSRA